MRTVKLAALFAAIQLAAVVMSFLVAANVADCHSNHLLLASSDEARGTRATIRVADTETPLWHGEITWSAHETPLAYPGEGRLTVESRLPDGARREVEVQYATSLRGREYVVFVDLDKDIQFSRELALGDTVIKLVDCLYNAAYERWLAPYYAE